MLNAFLRSERTYGAHLGAGASGGAGEGGDELPHGACRPWRLIRPLPSGLGQPCCAGHQGQAGRHVQGICARLATQPLRATVRASQRAAAPRAPCQDADPYSQLWASAAAPASSPGQEGAAAWDGPADASGASGAAVLQTMDGGPCRRRPERRPVWPALGRCWFAGWRCRTGVARRRSCSGRACRRRRCQWRGRGWVG